MTIPVPCIVGCEVERWLAVPGSDKHFVSSEGRVVKRVNAEHPERRQAFLMKWNVDKDGYHYLQINRKKWLAHRLVYAVFSNALNPDLVVCHVDGNKVNNSVSNLLQTTQAENISHKRLHGTHQEGQAHGSAHYTDDVVRKVKDAIVNARLGPTGRLRRGEPARIAALFGVSPGLVHSIRAKNAWAHL